MDQDRAGAEEMGDEAFVVLHPQTPGRYVFASPHSGTVYPPEMGRDPALTEASLRSAEDARALLLAGADVVVTINSAVGIEAMLHRVPVVLCGSADFHHICEPVLPREGLVAGNPRAAAPKAAGYWPFEAYLHWFYGQMCLDPTAPDFIDRFIARVAAQGYDLL